MTDFHIEKITDRCAEFGIKIDREITERLNLYGNLLLEWNEKINLTAITAPEDVLYKHFYDCILFFKAVTPDKNAEIIDVGTGAGFPGTVLKIIRPDLKITLLDSLNKRLLFLNEVISQLGLQNISTVHMRAVASLPALMEYCLPLVKKGGSFIAMKGASAAEEKALSLKAAGILGAAEPTIICETLTGNEQRAFVISKKISQTPTKYPRKPSDISKKPL